MEKPSPLLEDLPLEEGTFSSSLIFLFCLFKILVLPYEPPDGLLFDGEAPPSLGATGGFKYELLNAAS